MRLKGNSILLFILPLSAACGDGVVIVPEPPALLTVPAERVPVERVPLASANQPPSITWVHITPEEPTVWDDLRLEYSLFDPEDGPLAVDIQWFIDGEQVGVGSRLSWADKVGARQVRAELLVTDDHQEVVRAARIVDIANEVPLVTSCTIHPQSTSDAQTSWVAASSGSDPDGSPPELTYSWQVLRDGRYVSLPVRTPEFEGCNSTEPPLCFAGEEIRAVCEAYDGESYGSEASAAERIGNRPPELLGMDVVPGQLRPGRLATATLRFDEIDSQDVGEQTLTWLVNGQQAASGSAGLDQTLSVTVPASTLVLGADVELVGTVSDGNGGIASAQRSWRIGNTAPEIEVCASSPALASHEATWVASHRSVDSDGDTVYTTLTWQMEILNEDLEWEWHDVGTGATAPSCQTRRVPEIHARADYNCRPGGRFRVQCAVEDSHGATTVMTSEPGMFGRARPGPPCELYTRAESDFPGLMSSLRPGQMPLEALLTTYSLPTALGLEASCEGWSPPLTAPDFPLVSEPRFTRPQAGQFYRVVMDDVPSQRRARLFMSTVGVEEDGTCPSGLGGDCVDLLQATSVGTAFSQNGRVSFDVMVPATMSPGEHVWFQGVALAHTSAQSVVMQRELEAACSWDAAEPNDDRFYPYVFSGPGTLTDLEACASTEDWYAIDVQPGDKISWDVSWDPSEGRPRMRGIATDQGSFKVTQETGTWTWTGVAVVPGRMYLLVEAPMPDQGLTEGTRYDVGVRVRSQALACSTPDPGLVSLAATATYTSELCAPTSSHHFQILGAPDEHYLRVRLSWDPDEDAFELHHGAAGLQSRVYAREEQATVLLHVVDGAPIPLEVRRPSRSEQVSEGGGYQLVVQDLGDQRPGCTDDAAEPNDQVYQAQPLPVPQGYPGALCAGSVYDWFSVDVQDPSELSLTMFAEDDPVEVLLVNPDSEFELLGAVESWSGRLETPGQWQVGLWLPGQGPHPIEGGSFEWFDYGYRTGTNYLLNLDVTSTTPCVVDALEPDNEPDAGPVMAVPFEISGTVCGGDVDYVRIEAEAGDDFVVTLDHDREAGPLVSQIESEDGARFSMGRVILSTGSQVRFVAWEAGVYLVRVSADSDATQGVDAGDYTLRVVHE